MPVDWYGSPTPNNHADHCQCGLMWSLHGESGKCAVLCWNQNLLYLCQSTGTARSLLTTMPTTANAVRYGAFMVKAASGQFCTGTKICCTYASRLVRLPHS